MAIKGYSVFPKAGASSSDCLVSYLGHSWRGLTPLQRCSWFILQPQPTRLVFNFDKFTKTVGAKNWKSEFRSKDSLSIHPRWLHTLVSWNPGFEITFFLIWMWKIFFRTFLMQYHTNIKLVVIPNLGKVRVGVNWILKAQQTRQAEQLLKCKLGKKLTLSITSLPHPSDDIYIYKQKISSLVRESCGRPAEGSY